MIKFARRIPLLKHQFRTFAVKTPNVHQAEPVSESKHLVAQYRLVPVAEHPLFPGSSQALSLTKQQFEILKENSGMVFASVLKNDEVLKRETNIVQQMLDPRNLGDSNKTVDFNLPNIKELSDVYETGVLCDSKVYHDEKNFFMPYVLNLFPVQKAQLVSAVNHHEQIEPLCRVIVEKIYEEIATENDLNMNDNVIFKFLKQQYLKCFKIAPDDRFLQYLTALERSFDVTQVQSFIHMILTCVSMPQYVNTYKFLVNSTRHDLQDVFQEKQLSDRLNKANDLFTSFTNKLELWDKLEQQYDFKKDQAKTQKKLEEIYESLKKHFTNESDEKQGQVKQLLANLDGKSVPENVMKVINEEIQRFMQMEKHHSEWQVTKTYLEYLTKMPYGVYSEENFDISMAKDILDQGHYGMEDVKQRILEFIAIGKLNNSVQGKILCFVGPPGVGKTSIGASIAKALGREFHRISLGGDRDTSALKGFRRTYVGAVPGKIVRALKTVEVENPVILIDEVDKLGQRSAQGDPGSVLLEILDPEQNNKFTDDFLDVPIDLSKVLFLCTANMLDTLHPAVLDRMEIIEVGGYTFDEKKHILENYLLPEAISKAGLTAEHQFEIPQKTKDYIIEYYCREPGVRSLKKYIQKICEKIAFKIVETSNSQRIVVTEDNLEDFIGTAIFQSRRFYKDMPPGVVVGLAYSSHGGSILYIESQKANNANDSIETTESAPGSRMGSLKVTGQLGSVMQESSAIAMTFARNFMNENFASNKRAQQYLESTDIHIHFPEGSTPKDGPSAGITITTALVSLALNTPIKANVGMTGEISLTGKVLPIGGVKEKTMAASREGIKTLIFPKANEKDIHKLPAYIKEGVTFHLVEDYREVFEIVFPGVKI